MKLTKHFTYEEMTDTDTGISNSLTDEARIHLVYLCRKLEKVRKSFGHPIHISSGFRTTEVNKAVGGVSNSLHLTGRACDIKISHLSTGDVDTLYSLLDDTFPTELILYPSKGIIHYAI